MLLPLYDENPTRRWPIMTVAMVVINVLVFAINSNQDEHQQRVTFARFGFVPARMSEAAGAGQAVKVDLYPEKKENPQLPIPRGERFFELNASFSAAFATLVTSLFLHAGFLHLLGNMWFLWIFGNNVEDRLGPLIFLAFYLIGGMVASACHWISVLAAGGAEHVPLVGASGAVAVTLGAYIILYPAARVTCLLFFVIVVVLPAWIVLAFWFGAQLYQVHNNPELPVAYWAHIGGFLVGAILMPMLAAGTPDPGENWDEELETRVR